MNFNQRQLQIINDKGQLLLVIAGPGTGKTTTILKKAIKHKSLILTFSNKAQIDARQRLISIFEMQPLSLFEAQKQNRGVLIYTFHSLAYQLQKNFKNISLITEVASRIIYKKMFIDSKLPKNEKDAIFNAIPLFNAYQRLKIDNQYTQFNPKLRHKLIQYSKIYTRMLKKLQIIDYSELLVEFIESIRSKNNKIAMFLQQLKLDYILVDEFQDLNMLQLVFVMELLKILKVKLVVIGDPNQSIYGFRGAVNNIFDTFLKEFRNIFEINYSISKVKLYKNYRSAHKIIKVINSIFPSTLQLQSTAPKEKQGCINYVTTYNTETQYKFIAKEINDIVGGINNETTLASSLGIEDNTVDFSDFAIVTRTNFELQGISKIFHKFAIPHQIIGEDSFFNSQEVLFIIELLKFITMDNLPKNLDFLQLKSTYIDQKLVMYLLHKARENLNDVYTILGIEDEIKLKSQLSRKDVVLHHNDYKNISFLTSPIKDVFEYIRNFLHLRMTKNLKELQYFLLDRKIKNLTVKQFLKYFSKLKDTDFYDKHFNKVTLSTIHAVKGLEFKYVFLPNFTENNFPFISNKLQIFETDNLSEEKRLFYVAISRAEYGIYVIFPKYLNVDQQNSPSSFYQYIQDVADKKTDKGFNYFKNKAEKEALERDQYSLF